MEKLESKLKVIEGADFWNIPASEELGIPSIRLSDGPHGVRRVKNDKVAVDKNNTYYATCFPTASSLAQTFNKDLVYRVGDAIGKECLNLDVDVILGPGLNIKRSPLCGRNFEYYSEDPYLTAKLGVNFVKGVQSNGVGACIKHFACNNQETGRLINNSIVDERALHEIYLKAFEEVVKEADPYMVMASYNKLNNYPASESKLLLNDILREKWGYKGAVVSDWGAVNSRVNSLKAGLDLQMPGSNGFFNKDIKEALENNTLAIEDIDRAVNNIKTLADRLKHKGAKSEIDNTSLALEAALESMVLLKNEDNFLPLKKEEKVLVVGELFDLMRYQGGGSSDVVSNKVITPKQAFEANGVNFDYVDCYQLFKPFTNKVMLRDVKKLVKKYDKVLLFVGLGSSNEMEGADRENLAYPISQLDVIEELTFANPNTCLVSTHGSPVAMPFLEDCKAVVNMGLSGQMAGLAIYKLLYGEENFSGRLNETYPLSERKMPCFYTFANDLKQTVYEESIFVGYRYYETKKEPVLFPFGYGLSYSEALYSDFNVTREGSKINISFNLTNNGKYPLKEVVQVYVGKEKSNVYRAVKELKAFEKVSLNAHESKKVTLSLERDAFEIYDIDTHNFVVEEGVYNIYVSKNASEDLFVCQEELEGVNLVNRESKLPGLYKTFEFSTMELKNILDVEIQSSLDDKRSDVTFDSTLAAIAKKSYFGRKIVENMKNRAFNGADMSDLGVKTIVESLDNQTFRSVVISSGGALTREMGERLLEISNMDFLDGLKAFKELKNQN